MLQHRAAFRTYVMVSRSILAIQPQCKRQRNDTHENSDSIIRQRFAMMRPSEVADRLDVSTASIRSWSADFAEFLSSKAAGGEGRHRAYDEQDARVLAVVGILKLEGMTKDDIRATLITMQDEDWIDLPPMPAAPPGVGPVPMIPAHSAATEIQTLHVSHMREIAILEDRIDTLETQLTEANADRVQVRQDLSQARADLARLEGERTAETRERKFVYIVMLAVAIVAAVLFVLMLIALTGPT